MKVEQPTVQLRETIKIVLLHPVHLVAVGSMTGQRYEWSNSGSIVEVDKLDVDELLSKRVSICSDCASSGLESVPYFQIA